MFPSNIRLYDKDGFPITIRYVCAHCGHEMKVPYLIVYGTDEDLFYCKDCHSHDNFAVLNREEDNK
jgi:ribosomal protein L44E